MAYTWREKQQRVCMIIYTHIICLISNIHDNIYLQFCQYSLNSDQLEALLSWIKLGRTCIIRVTMHFRKKDSKYAINIKKLKESGK